MMQQKVQQFIINQEDNIDFSEVKNLDEATIKDFEDFIKVIRSNLQKEKNPAATAQMVSDKVGEMFETDKVSHKSVKGKFKKFFNVGKDGKAAKAGENPHFITIIENFKAPEVDLRAVDEPIKEIFRVLQGVTYFAQQRDWRLIRNSVKFRIPYGKNPEGMPFYLQRQHYETSSEQIYYKPETDQGKEGHKTSYKRDFFAKFKGPIEREKVEEIYRKFLNSHDDPVDVSELEDGKKHELQKAISDVQNDLRLMPAEADRQEIMGFAKKLIKPSIQRNAEVPDLVDNLNIPGVREHLETLKEKLIFFTTIRTDEQMNLARFMLDTVEKTGAEQPSFDTVPGLRQDPVLQKAVFDFLAVTHISECSEPTKEFLKLMRDKKIVDISEDNINMLKDTNVIDKSVRVTGRTMGTDAITRKKLKDFISESTAFTTLQDLFSDSEFPAQVSAKRGRQYAAENMHTLVSPGPTTQGRHFFATEIESQIDELPESSVTADARESMAIDLTQDSLFAKSSNKRARTNEEDIEVAAKEARLEGDANYLTDAAENVLKCPPSKRSDSHHVGYHLQDKIHELWHKRQGICALKEKLVLDEDSIEVKNNKLVFELHEPHNKDAKHKVSKEIDERHLASLRYVVEKERYMDSTKQKGSLKGKIGTALGVHGLVMNVFGAVRAFEEENTVSGAITTSQTIHSLKSFKYAKKLTDFSVNIGKKALQKSVMFGAKKLGVSSIAEKATSKLARLAKSDAGLLLGDIPFVGLAFDAYFIANDIKELSNADFSDPGEVVLDVVHLALDVSTTVGNILVDTLGPEFEPVVWALSLLRMGIDDFYIDISEELKKAHGLGGKVLAVFKGIAEGFVDFLTGGLLRGLKQLNERKRHDRDLLNKLANPVSYYKLEGTDCQGKSGTIDFMSGAFSGQGGDIKFELNDDDSFVVTLSGVPTEGGERRTVSKTLQCRGLRDIVLGVGETKDAVWKRQKAQLFGVITVKSADVIDHFKTRDGTLYGTYTGNKQNNTFYTFQGTLGRVFSDECKDPKATGVIDIRIKNYYYLLNGLSGNDTFFIGPQKSHVTGGTGHDLYYVGTHGGRTVIDNFALDKLSDTLFLNVSHNHVICGRKDFDLVITYCGTHMVQVKEWFFPFENEFRQHLVIIARDGIQLKVKDLGIEDDKYKAACVPISVDKSKSTTSQIIDLREGQYLDVVTVTGSQQGDIITGNDKDNYINAGPGQNRLTGGEGADTYVLSPMKYGSKVKREQHEGQCDIINNFANDLHQDKLFLPINYEDVSLTASRQQDLVVQEKKSISRKKLRLKKSIQTYHSSIMDSEIKQGEKNDKHMQELHMEKRAADNSQRMKGTSLHFFADYFSPKSSDSTWGYIGLCNFVEVGGGSSYFMTCFSLFDILLIDHILVEEVNFASPPSRFVQ